MVKNKLIAKWEPGALVLNINPNELHIEGENFTLVFKPRNIEFKGPWSSVEESVKRNRKYVYIVTSEELRGIRDAGRIDILAGEELLFDSFELRLNITETTSYLTVIVPGLYLYNYAIVTNEKRIMIETIARRKIFTQTEEDELVIYLV